MRSITLSMKSTSWWHSPIKRIQQHCDGQKSSLFTAFDKNRCRLAADTFFNNIVWCLFLVGAAAIPIKIFSATLLEYFSSLFVHKSLESLSFRPLKCFVSLATEREKNRNLQNLASHISFARTHFSTPKSSRFEFTFLTTVPINLYNKFKTLGSLTSHSFC